MGLLYTKMKVFHFKDKIDSLARQTKEIMPPIHIRIKPTNVCNHNCRYCAYRVDGLQLGQDMSVRDYIPEAKMKEIVEDLSEMGVRAVTFSGGGEPFCYPYLPGALRLLVKKGVKFASLTNGSKLEGETAEIFSRYATWIRVSMDGWDDESYTYYRQVKAGEYSRIMKNIEAFKKLKGGCYLGVSLIIDKFNIDHLYEMIKRLKEIGADSVKVSPCIVSNSGTENNRYHKPLFGEVKDHVTRAKRDFADTEFEVFDAYHDLGEDFKKDYTWCPYLQILPVIGADLNIYPCQDKAYNLKEGLVGSIKGRRFKDFWFSDKENFFKINPSRACNHHCVANEKNRMIFEYLNTDKGHLEFV